MSGGIFSGDDYLAAARQQINMTKTVTRTSVAAAPFSLFDVAGAPGAGALAVGNTAAGVVPVDTDAGYPTINNFAAGAIGYLTGVDFGSSVACRITLFDRLFAAGAYNYNDNIALAAQPSFASRVPSADYKGLELWVEAVTAFTGIPTIGVTYTNDAGTAGRTTSGVVAPAALTLGRMMRLPLQASTDAGVQKVESVFTTGTAATAGTFNVNVMRRLGSWRVKSAGDGGSLDIVGVKPRRIYATSALFMMITPDSTATGLPDLDIEIASY